MLAAPWVIWATAPGLPTAGKFELTTDLLRVTFPYILLISLSSWPGRSSIPGTVFGAGLRADPA
jgi:putative peptidoglycan lipid II flippase